MSSLSMAINGKGIRIGNNESNPGTLNAWLRGNKGYTTVGGDPDNLVLDAPDKIHPGIKFISEAQKPPPNIMAANILKQNPVMILHVRNRTHFVLAEGFDSSSDSIFYVNDPFYNSTSYHWNEVADILLYEIQQQK